MRENTFGKLVSNKKQGGDQTYIEHIEHFIMGVNLFNGTT